MRAYYILFLALPLLVSEARAQVTPGQIRVPESGVPVLVDGFEFPIGRAQYRRS